MANTYSQLYIQVVFAVRNRQCLIQPEWKDSLYAYITGIVQGEGHKILQINGMPDHIHIFFGHRPSQSISDLIKKVKGKSSKWINNEGLLKNEFYWQAGYGAFSYHRSMIPTIINYIKNQEEHHKKTSFIEEYESLLEEYLIEYDKRYIFNPVL